MSMMEGVLRARRERRKRKEKRKEKEEGRSSKVRKARVNSGCEGQKQNQRFLLQQATTLKFMRYGDRRTATDTEDGWQ